ncbi:7870_t:CDS:2, partial [Scutellospora calospora]
MPNTEPEDNNAEGPSSIRAERLESENLKSQEMTTLLLSTSVQLKEYIDQFLQASTTMFTTTIKQLSDNRTISSNTSYIKNSISKQQYQEAASNNMRLTEPIIINKKNNNQ